MCIFIGDTQVAQTKIATARQGKHRQLVVYQNTVRSTTTTTVNAMILPVPGPAADVQLIDMTGHGDLWQKLEDATPRSPSYGGKDEYDLAEFAALDEIRVGSYRCNIAPTLDDLKRATLPIPDNIEAILKLHYGEGFCFLVCAFDGGGDDVMEPLAYTHALHSSGALFIPTRHAHGYEPADKRTKRRGSSDFDHIIYLVNALLVASVKELNQLDYQGVYDCFHIDNLRDVIPEVDVELCSIQKVVITEDNTQVENQDFWAQ